MKLECPCLNPPTVIQYEKPDGAYVIFGGQTALNVGIKLAWEADGDHHFVGDRQLFAVAMKQMGNVCAERDRDDNRQSHLPVGSGGDWVILGNRVLSVLPKSWLQNIDPLGIYDTGDFDCAVRCIVAYVYNCR